MIVILFLIITGILVSLAFSLFYFVRNKNRQDEKKIVRSLTIRILLSMALFLLLLLGYALGWLQPHGLPF